MPQRSAPNNQIPKGHLRNRSDYLKSYKGFGVRRPLLVLYARSNGILTHRFGFTTPKTMGNAVVRNRYKRWCREFYKSADMSSFKKAIDLHVFIGNKKIKKEEYKSVKFEEFWEQLNSALQFTVKNFK